MEPRLCLDSLKKEKDVRAPAGFEDRTVQSLYRLLHPALHKMLPYSVVILHQYIACSHVGDSSTMHISCELSNKLAHIFA